MRVTVHMFRVYDVQTDEFFVSKRMATKDAIDRAKGELIEGTASTIEASDLDPAITGMTPKGYQPKPAGPATFQTVVRS